MIIRRLIPPSAVALAILACAETSAPPMPDVPRFSAAVGNHRVVGAGHVEQATGLREFTFHAIEQSDGTCCEDRRVPR